MVIVPRIRPLVRLDLKYIACLLSILCASSFISFLVLIYLVQLGLNAETASFLQSAIFALISAGVFIALLAVMIVIGQYVTLPDVGGYRSTEANEILKKIREERDKRRITRDP